MNVQSIDFLKTTARKVLGIYLDKGSCYHLATILPSVNNPDHLRVCEVLMVTVCVPK